MKKREELEPKLEFYLNLPEPPSTFTPKQRACWFEVGEPLARIGLLAEVDLPLFECFVCAMVRLRALNGLLPGAAEAVFKDRDGNLRLHPLARERRQAEETVLRFARHFGLSPAARATMAVEPSVALHYASRSRGTSEADADDPWAEFMKPDAKPR